MRFLDNCLSFFSFLLAIILSDILRFTASAYLSGIFKLFSIEELITEEFEDTKGVIRIRISKNRQHNGQKKKYKSTNNDLKSVHIKLKIE
jgi:hypothetical protein